MTNALEPSHFTSGAAPSGPRWWWRLEDESGQAVTPGAYDGVDFPAQSDAETWVGEVWRDLLDAGVDQVTLFEGDREVYGPMSLHAA